MSTTKHMQGSWEVDENAPLLPIEGHAIRDTKDGFTLAMLWEGGGTDGKSMQRANANLIAAAPEMLEALEDALEQLKRFEVGVDGEMGWRRNWEEIDKSGEHCPEITAARAAIAKAKGEQS